MKQDLPLDCLRVAFRYFRLSFELLVVTFFIGYGFYHRNDISISIQRIPLPMIGLSILLYIPSQFFAALAAKQLFASARTPLKYTEFLKIQLRNLPAKYLPGGVWHTVGRGADLTQSGIRKHVVLQVLLLEQFLAIWWAGVLGLLLFCLLSMDGMRWLVIVTLVLLLLSTGIVVSLLSRLHASWVPLIRSACSPLTVAAYVAGWCCLGGAFSSYMWFSGLIQLAPPKIAAAYLLSWATGALAFFAPQGLGVFEFTMERIAFQANDRAQVLWMIGSYRVIVLLADLVSWGASVLWRVISNSDPISGQER